MSALLKEAKTVSLLVRMIEEQVLQRFQRNTYKRSVGRLTTLSDRYEEKTIHTSDFLREVGNIYTQPVPDHVESDSDSDKECVWLM